MAEEKRCAKCDKVVEEYSYGDYCSSCADAVWDAGFESTSQHAYEIGFNQLVDRLQKPCDKDVRKAIGEIMGEWGALTWTCPKCGKVRLHKKESKTLAHEQQVARVCGPCECGEEKCALPSEPERFFH